MYHKFFRHLESFWDVGIKTEYSRFIEGIL